MSQVYFTQRLEAVTKRISTIGPNIERARQSVRRLEIENVPVGAAAEARAAQLSAARAMASTLEERARQLRIAEASLRAELGG